MKRSGTSILYTIGHGSRELQGFLQQLRDVGVTLLVDVRTFPRSRWSKQFDKQNLSRPEATPGMTYRHRPELGGYEPGTLSERRARVKDDNWWAGIKWLAGRCKREVVAIMCMESDYRACHRHSTIEPDLRAAAPEVEIIHLGPPAKTKQQLGLSGVVGQ